MAARAARPLTAARAAPARRTAPARARAAPTPPRAAGGAPAEPAPAALREAAALVADRWVSSGAAVGLGTGAAVSALLKELAARLADGRLMHVRAVPSSDATASEAAFAGVPLATLADAGGALDLLVDVASELDVSATGNLAYIVGRGASGPQAGLPDLLRLRALGAAARLRVVVAEAEGDCAARLGGSVPVLVAGGDAAWEEAAEELDDAFLGDAELWRRGLEPGAGPRGGDLPYVDAGGHSILDLRFPEDGLRLLGEPAAYAAIAAEIEGVAGVAAHGLVAGGADAAVVAGAEGVVVVERAECMAAE